MGTKMHKIVYTGTQSRKSCFMGLTRAVARAEKEYEQKYEYGAFATATK